MRPDQVAELPEYFGLHFDATTGMMYYPDGTETGFTFEKAHWTGPFGLHLPWPWLNPLAFATQETAGKMLRFARTIAPAKLTVEMDDTQRVTGPFTRTVERLIVISDGGTAQQFSAGWMANTVIRQGETRAAESFRAEWRSAGIQF